MKCSVDRPGDHGAGRKAQLWSPQRLGRGVFIVEGNKVFKPVSYAETKWPPVVSKRQATLGDFEKYWNGILQLWTYTVPFTSSSISERAFFFFFKDCKLLGNNLEGWDGEEGGKDVQVGGDPSIPMADSC